MWHLYCVSNEGNKTFPIVVIFFRGCVPGLVMPSCTVRFIYFPKKLGLCRLSRCSLMTCTYNRVHYGPMVAFLCLNIKLPHYHHYAALSEGIELLKGLSVNSVSRVCLRFSQFSQLCFQYMGLCLLSLHISLMIVRIRRLHLIIIIKSEVCPICHCLGLDHETMVCNVSFYIPTRNMVSRVH